MFLSIVELSFQFILGGCYICSFYPFIATKKMSQSWIVCPHCCFVPVGIISLTLSLCNITASKIQISKGQVYSEVYIFIPNIIWSEDMWRLTLVHIKISPRQSPGLIIFGQGMPVKYWSKSATDTTADSSMIHSSYCNQSLIVSDGKKLFHNDVDVGPMFFINNLQYLTLFSATAKLKQYILIASF